MTRETLWSEQAFRPKTSVARPGWWSVVERAGDGGERVVVVMAVMAVMGQDQQVWLHFEAECPRKFQRRNRKCSNLMLTRRKTLSSDNRSGREPSVCATRRSRRLDEG